MRLLNDLQARLAGLSRRACNFSSLPEPRGAGSVARAQQLLEGQLRFGGVFKQLTPGSSPFGWPDAPPAFDSDAQAFGWLLDLAALGTPAASELARRWFAQWHRLYGRGKGRGWSPEVTARRVSAMIDCTLFIAPSEAAARGAHEPTHKGGKARAIPASAPASARTASGHGDAVSLMLRRSLARQSRYLERMWQTAPSGLPKLRAILALLQIAQTLEGKAPLLAPAARALGHEAALAIDDTGSIPSRNPEELLEIFALLTRAVQVLAEADHSPSPEHIAALGRAAPVLRALRHADGNLARFHGGDCGDEGKLDHALAASAVRSGALSGLAMGFGRMAHGRTSLIIDLAAPATEASLGAASGKAAGADSGFGAGLAQASTLAIELTSGRRPLIVTAGPGQEFGAGWAQAARATAAASTLEILDISSSRLGTDKRGRRSAGFTEVPTDVREQRTSDETGSEIIASHDGYVDSHGLTHMRRISLSADGRALLGEDTLAAVKAEHQRLFDAALAREGDAAAIRFALRFHLHPDVEAALDAIGGSVHLRLRSGEVWSFRHDGVARLTLEPSAWLGKPNLNPVPSKQMVLSAAAIDYASRVRWSLAKAPDTPLSTRDLLRDAPDWPQDAPDRKQ